MGEMKVPFVTDEGRGMKMRIKAGDVNKTLISVSRLQDAGFDTNLTKKNPHIRHERTGERIRLIKKGGMFILPMWLKIGEGSNLANGDSPFTRQGR